LRSALLRCGRSDLADVLTAKEEFIRRDMFEKAQHGKETLRSRDTLLGVYYIVHAVLIHMLLLTSHHHQAVKELFL